MHGADAKKHRLEKRFGDPSLHSKLFTPMLHKSVQHLLPSVYSGRVESSTEKMGSVMVDGATAGGLTFNMLETRDLALDRAQYLRHRDEDAISVSASTVLGSGKNQGGYFDAQRQDYLSKGMERTESDYDISRMATRDGQYASTENLILSQPPQYIPDSGGRYSPSLSQRSFDYNYSQPEFLDPNYARGGTPDRYDDRTGSPQRSRYDQSTYQPYDQSFDSNNSSGNGNSYPPVASRPNFIAPNNGNEDLRDGNRRM